MTRPTPPPLTIWTNAEFPPRAAAALREGLQGYRLVNSANLSASNLIAAGADPSLEQADVAFGQPDADQVLRVDRLKWVHITTAGYTRYDRKDLRDALRARGGALTNSSQVYAEPGAEHLLAMMMGFARRLPHAVDEQRGDRAWRAAEHRIKSRLLTGQTAVLLGYGAIGRRLAELLQPLRMNVMAVRRHVAGDEPVRTVSMDQVDAVLPGADHVVNILPASPQTENFLSAERVARLKPGAIVYNIGRGTTIDQDALTAALRSGHLGGAYLDVTNPEPLPKDHPLWSLPNCYITPHTAGGADDEFDRLVAHFLENLRRFERDEELEDRII